jgi:hypothetical protein
MSFTTPILVKTHLLTGTFPELVIRDHAVTFTDTTEIELPHHNLVADSIVVKRDVLAAPYLDSSATLKEEEFVSLEHAQLVPGSAVVTLSEALTTVYVDEVDYQIDYVNGRVRRLASGSIPDQQPVIVYYDYFSLFERGPDFSIDEANGILTREEGGAISAGATVLVDYTVAAGAVEDDLITEAIAEAEDMILRLLSPDYNSGSTDQGLKTGATELSLSIICRAAAAEALSRRATTDISGRAKEWQQLSRFYEQQAWNTLAPFLLPLSVRSPFRQPRDTN